MFTSLISLFTSLTVHINAFYVGVGTGLIFASLGLALFGRFLFIPKWTSQIQPTIDKIDAGIQAQPSTPLSLCSRTRERGTDVEVGSSVITSYSEASVNYLSRV